MKKIIDFEENKRLYTWGNEKRDYTFLEELE